MGCPDRDDLVGHALGALEPRRERAVGRHTARCERCGAELRRFAPAVGVLAESVEQLEPPESLRQSLLATAHAEAAEPVAPEPRAGAPGRVRGFLWRPVAALGAAALVAAGAVGYVVRDEGESTKAYPINSSLPEAGGTIEVSGDEATLHAHGMPALGTGEVYQVWVADGGEISPSATFVPHADGTATAAVPEAAAGAEQVLVTEEPRPGRQIPSSPAVLDARLD